MRSTSPALALSLLVLAGCHESGSDPAPLPSPLALNLELAADRIFGTGDVWLIGASEEGEGRDLDGDGDATGVVLHLLDLGIPAFANVGLAFPRRFQRDEVPPPQFGCNDALGVFQISESETGRDVDLDGTPGEVNTWIFDRERGSLLSLAFTHGQLALEGSLAAFLAADASGGGPLVVYDGRDGSLTTRAVEPSYLFGAGDGIVAFARYEEGAFDLNADGDTADGLVLHLYDADSKRVANASLDVEPGTLRISAGFAGFNVSEAKHGGLDLNGDRDASDLVFVAVNGKSGLTRIPGFGGAAFLDSLQPTREGFLLGIPEQDGDRNGDGDRNDLVAALYDPRSDRLFDTGLATSGQPLLQSERWLGVVVLEGRHGDEDLDRDGRLESDVPHVFDTLTGRSENLGFHGFWIGAFERHFLAARTVVEGSEYELVVWDARARRLHRTGFDARNVLGTSDGCALVSVREHSEDLNRDGDTADFVLAIYDGRTGSVVSLGVATSVFQGRLGPRGEGAVLVSEEAQGADLNGDGDRLDQVLHQFFVEGPRG